MNINFIKKILGDSEFNSFIEFDFFTINKNFDGLNDFLEKIKVYNFDKDKMIILEEIFISKGEGFSLENKFLEILTGNIEKCFDFIDLDGDKNKLILESQKGLKVHIEKYNGMLGLVEKGIKLKRKKDIKLEDEYELSEIESELDLVY